MPPSRPVLIAAAVGSVAAFGAALRFASSSPSHPPSSSSPPPKLFVDGSDSAATAAPGAQVPFQAINGTPGGKATLYFCSGTFAQEPNDAFIFHIGCDPSLTPYQFGPNGTLSASFYAPGPPKGTIIGVFLKDDSTGANSNPIGLTIT